MRMKLSKKRETSSMSKWIPILIFSILLVNGCITQVSASEEDVAKGKVDYSPKELDVIGECTNEDCEFSKKALYLGSSNPNNISGAVDICQNKIENDSVKDLCLKNIALSVAEYLPRNATHICKKAHNSGEGLSASCHVEVAYTVVSSNPDEAILACLYAGDEDYRLYVSCLENISEQILPINQSKAAEVCNFILSYDSRERCLSKIDPEYREVGVEYLAEPIPSISCNESILKEVNTIIYYLAPESYNFFAAPDTIDNSQDKTIGVCGMRADSTSCRDIGQLKGIVILIGYTEINHLLKDCFDASQSDRFRKPKHNILREVTAFEKDSFLNKDETKEVLIIVGNDMYGRSDLLEILEYIEYDDSQLVEIFENIGLKNMHPELFSEGLKE